MVQMALLVIYQIQKGLTRKLFTNQKYCLSVHDYFLFATSLKIRKWLQHYCQCINKQNKYRLGHMNSISRERFS